MPPDPLAVMQDVARVERIALADSARARAQRLQPPAPAP
jgi:hypothetical protein